ncbi:hypothetical protein [Nocardia ninae]|uniref:Uncharacterized protein n=1 Tax=Nocardia ninae NBRC 108245 TaxID=1210091 RepID=A0A511MQ94_9NOCA|nr:hypothetical protein [Nocardia ninae]GEM42146.1 hypothetical protein NN4_66650 [Nocardia ninae NBRC 108245]
MFTTLFDKALAAIPLKELYFLGASAVAIPLLLSMFGDQIAWDTALSAGSVLTHGADWTTGQAWVEQARAWITDPTRAAAITLVCPVLIWITVGLNHARLRGQRPVYAIPTAVYCMAALVEVGAVELAWTSLAIGVALSALPVLDRHFPIRSVLGAVSFTFADLLSTALRIVSDLLELVYNLHDRQASPDDAPKRALPEPVAIPPRYGLHLPEKCAKIPALR